MVSLCAADVMIFILLDAALRDVLTSVQPHFLFYCPAVIFRRSVSTVDSAFGLTEKQRSAKEKEEQIIALVEIQRRDENSFPALGVSCKTHSHRHVLSRL